VTVLRAGAAYSCDVAPNTLVRNSRLVLDSVARDNGDMWEYAETSRVVTLESVCARDCIFCERER